MSSDRLLLALVVVIIILLLIRHPKAKSDTFSPGSTSTYAGEFDLSQQYDSQGQVSNRLSQYEDSWNDNTYKRSGKLNDAATLAEDVINAQFSSAADITVVPNATSITLGTAGAAAQDPSEPYYQESIIQALPPGMLQKQEQFKTEIAKSGTGQFRFLDDKESSDERAVFGGFNGPALDGRGINKNRPVYTAHSLQVGEVDNKMAQRAYALKRV